MSAAPENRRTLSVFTATDFLQEIASAKGKGHVGHSNAKFQSGHSGSGWATFPQPPRRCPRFWIHEQWCFKGVGFTVSTRSTEKNINQPFSPEAKMLFLSFNLLFSLNRIVVFLHGCCCICVWVLLLSLLTRFLHPSLESFLPPSHLTLSVRVSDSHPLKLL